MYKQYIDTMTGQVATGAIIRTADGICIPFNPENSDYAEYLKWVAEGNTPLPAEEN